MRLSPWSSQASCTPLAIQISILAIDHRRLSLGDITSTTNSGARRRYFLRSALVSLLNDSFETQAASGENAEPSGRKNPALDPNALPRLSAMAQLPNWRPASRV